jgi:hypothetical protein
VLAHEDHATYRKWGHDNVYEILFTSSKTVTFELISCPDRNASDSVSRAVAKVEGAMGMGEYTEYSTIIEGYQYNIGQ